MSHSKERWPPPPLFMVPMAEMSTEEASTRLEPVSYTHLLDVVLYALLCP